jgi:hypothetical protein
MQELTFKYGIITFGVALILFLIESFVYIVLGFSAQAGSGKGTRYIFIGLYFVIVLTATVGISALAFALLNQIHIIKISVRTFFVLSLIIGILVYIFI